MAKTPEVIIKLVENFEQNLESFKRAGYNEATLRQEFINPFFEALGWDIQNKAGIAQAYKDVIHEDSIKIGTSTKAPDYCFRIGQTKKFFLEAKKPAVDIKSEISPAYQLRRYAWSAKLPLSILTDFEEFAVYDCQIRPNVNDKAMTARIFYCTYKEYSDKWEQIANVFSKEAVLKGLFDKYASEKTTKKGTTTVDKEFLAEIEKWRDELAKNIAIRNGKLSVYDLNFAVQKTIDRILFLRICEDRGIERSEQLLGFINGSRIYPRLFELFEKADEKYNSGIFHFRREKDRPEGPDEISANLKVDDDILKKIIRDLYYPCPYEFSIMPAEILGQVYEQFLGKVIRLTESHQAKVEEKPEVKKAGGVYYTPSYIVDYIVKNTVGKLCENKTPKQIEKIKILDPACGSGSFLIGAYKYLLDYHRDYYEKERSKYKKVIYQGKVGQWFLTIEEKKRILLNNIYGVDIDSQAVEVTKLSLLLKVLENETQESLRLFHERALPDLGANIKCGNSLIGPDFYQNQQLSLFGDEQQRKVNAFDWQKEFSEILTGKNPGFDAVIGNPPYLKEKNNKEIFGLIRKSNTNKYCTGKMDICYAFACVTLDLLRNGGFHSFIAPNNWITNYGASILRRKVMSEAKLLKFIDFADYRVFKTASIQTMIYVMKKESSKFPYQLDYLKISDASIEESEVSFNLLNNSTANSFLWERAMIDPAREEKPFTLAKTKIDIVLQKIERIPKKHFYQNEIGNGIDVLQDFVNKNHLLKLRPQQAKIGDGIFVLSHAEKKSVVKSLSDEKKVKPYYTPREIGRYVATNSNKYWIIYADKDVRENVNNYPGIKNHLDKYKPILTSVYKPYGLHRPRDEHFFNGPKILSMRKTRMPSFSLVNFPCYVSRMFLILKPKNWPELLPYILGILNSKLSAFWLYHRGKKQGDQLQIDKEPLETFPIRVIDFDNSNEVKKHDRMVSLVDEMLELHKKINTIKNPEEKTRIQRQIDSTDSQIDRLVYELYGLTQEEIKIVEG
jgi:adenine-specific DNA-methyltransferase